MATCDGFKKLEFNIYLTFHLLQFLFFVVDFFFELAFTNRL